MAKQAKGEPNRSALSKHSSCKSVASKPKAGKGGATKRDRAMDFRATSETGTIYREPAPHSLPTATGKRYHTTALLRAVHKHAYEAYVDVLEHRARISPPRPPAIIMHVNRQIQSHPWVSPPMKKGEFRTTSMSIEAWSHDEIDSFAEQYITVARTEGLWGHMHNAPRGRLDRHGVFHDLESGTCPRTGRIVAKPGGVRAKFDKKSLADYRRRVADLHKVLDSALAKEKRQNARNGWTKSNEAFCAAHARLSNAWNALLARAGQGTLTDIKEICRHVISVREDEIQRVERDDSSIRRIDDVEDEWNINNCDLLETIAG